MSRDMKLLAIVLAGACSGAEPLAVGEIVLREGTVVAGDTIEPPGLRDAFARAAVHVTLPHEEFDDRITRQGLDAHAALAPEIELDFVLDERGLVSLDATITGRLDAQLAVAREGERSVTTLASEPRQFVARVDDVPLAFTTRVLTEIAIDAGGPAALDARTTAGVILAAEAHYDRFAGWTTLDTSERSAFVVAHGEHAATRTHVEAAITQHLEVALYGERLAYVELRTTSGAESAGCVTLGEGSVAAAMGIDVAGELLRYTPLFRQLHPVISDACP